MPPPSVNASQAPPPSRLEQPKHNNMPNAPTIDILPLKCFQPCFNKQIFLFADIMRKHFREAGLDERPCGRSPEKSSRRQKLPYRRGKADQTHGAIRNFLRVFPADFTPHCLRLEPVRPCRGLSSYSSSGADHFGPNVALHCTTRKNFPQRCGHIQREVDHVNLRHWNRHA
jgi:hypothetical protein